MKSSRMLSCENCSRQIGNLETPNVFKDRVVCAECYERLVPVARPITPAQATTVAPTVLCKINDIIVTTFHIESRRDALLIEDVLSVMTETSFLLGKTVTVFELSRRKHRFNFRGSSDATEFIKAIKRAKPSVYIEKPDDGGFFVIWG